METKSRKRTGLSCLFVLLAARLWAQDCNGNITPDSDDIRTGYSKDCNFNGVPDECDVLPRMSYHGAISILAARRPRAIAAIDLDFDSDLDLVSANAASGNLSFLHNDSLGGFTVAGQEATASEPWAMAAGDLEGDSDVDVAVPNQGSGTVSIWLNGQDGRLRRTLDLDAGRRPIAVVIARLNGDELPDLSASLYESRSLKVWMNQGGGAFGAGQEIALNAWPTSLVATDFDADGLMDLATTVYEERVLPNGSKVRSFELRLLKQGGGAFSLAATHPMIEIADSLSTADLNKDGRPDFVATISGSRRLMIFWSVPGGGFESDGRAMDLGYMQGTPVDFDLDGDMDLVLSGERVTLLRNGGDRTFESSEPLALGAEPGSVAAADLDGDGNLELAVANAGFCCNFGASSVWIVAGDGGGLTPVAQVLLEPPYRRLAGGDLDRDGLRDLIAGGDEGISLLFNGPPGEFRSAVNLPAPRNVDYLVAANLDGDLQPEIVASHEQDGILSVLWNQGGGSYSPPQTLSVAPLTPEGLATADLDGDGDTDIVVCDKWHYTLLVLRNDGALGFAEGVRLEAMTARPYTAVPLDLDADGDKDLVLETSGDSRILWNDGSFIFREEAISFPVPARFLNEALDVDGDGRLDLVARGNDVQVTRALAGGTLSRRSVAYVQPIQDAAAAGGDFDGDGLAEVALSGGETMPLLGFLEVSEPAHSQDRNGNGVPDECDLELNDCNANGLLDLEEIRSGRTPDCNSNEMPDECDLKPHLALAPAEGFPVGANPYAVLAADLDGDADLDVATANRESNDISVLLNSAQRTFLSEVRYPVVANAPNESMSSNPDPIVAGDFDQDGDIDLATKDGRFSTSSLDTAISLFWNGGDGGFLADPAFLNAGESGGLLAADLTGDGLPDLATVGQEMEVLVNSPQGFRPATRSPLPLGTFAVFTTAVDVDLDGDWDLLACGHRLVALRNRGDGALEIASDLVLNDTAGRAAADDLDGDGDADLVLSFPVGEKVSVHLNDGTGTFGPAKLELPAPSALDVALADLDGDRDSDLIVTEPDINTVGVWLNDGKGGVGPPREVPGGEVPLAVITADIDGSGLPDVVFTVGEHTQGDDFVKVLPNYSGWSGDCDLNGLPDPCDVAAGTLSDTNGDGIADVCLLRLKFRANPLADLFHRGDPNGDGNGDISDAILVLGFLFLGTERPSCFEAADFNNDASVDISDAIAELGYLFLGGPPAAPPGPPPAPCGVDPDKVGSPGYLGCESYPRC
ncbi:MAG: VCBS repeat-containing protein [Planctomycetes bacterium]|nr:VCBS repeat-containing protein [Planctomycetota bacterium]